MKLSAAKFKLLRPVAVNLRPWNKPTLPVNVDNPIRTIMHFARFMGLTSIPAKTMEMLRDHPYFRYVFFQLRPHGVIYSDLLGTQDRPRLVELLQCPEQFNDHDLFRGLKQYLNNFPANLPGGRNWKAAQEAPAEFREFKAKADKVAEALKALRLEEGPIVEMQAAAIKEMMTSARYTEQVELFKLSLKVFHFLVEQGSFTPEQLWK